MLPFGNLRRIAKMKLMVLGVPLFPERSQEMQQARAAAGQRRHAQLRADSGRRQSFAAQVSPDARLRSFKKHERCDWKLAARFCQRQKEIRVYGSAAWSVNASDKRFTKPLPACISDFSSSACVFRPAPAALPANLLAYKADSGKYPSIAQAHRAARAPCRPESLFLPC